MCKKLPYCNPRRDKCLVELLNQINKEGKYRTLASCCGHGRYPPTIVVKNKNNGDVFEYFTRTRLNMPKRNRFYKTDESNYYYLNPMVIKK